MGGVASAARSSTALVTDQGVQFIARHEGFRSRAYRDSGGVLTIGYGFTMRSRIFAEWWRAKHGRALQIGDTITRADADVILGKLLDEEYLPPVVRKFGPGRLPPHQQDGSGSVVYNAGAGTLGDRWANALAGGNVAEAARLLKQTRVTAGGTFVQGLANRRSAEARLIQFADYGNAGASPAVSTAANDVTAYQRQLIALGFLAAGADDGVAGPVTLAAVRRFQSDSGLVVDGKVGPATRAALTRAVEARRAAQSTAAGGVAGGAAGAADSGFVGSGSDPSALADVATGALVAGLAVAAIVLAGWLVWRNRKRIGAALSKFKP